jgi:hypothetical protein
MSVGSAAWFSACWVVSAPSARGWKPSRAAMPAAFAGRGRGGLVIAEAAEVVGVVEPSVGQLAGGCSARAVR